MTQDAAETARIVLPPRPNPGPEPWPAAAATPIWSRIALLGVLLFAALVVFRYWRSTRRRKDPKGAVAATEAESTEGHRLIRDAEAVRAALTGRFGPSWAAKTTEEIDASLQGMETFDGSIRDRMIGFLREADRAKFADRRDEEALQCDGPAEWVGTALAAIAAAGASSTIKAK